MLVNKTKIGCCFRHNYVNSNSKHERKMFHYCCTSVKLLQYCFI